MLRLVARGLGLAIALTVVSPGAATAKDAVVVKLRDGGVAKPARPKTTTTTRATKRKVVKKRQAKAARAAKPKQPKRKRSELRPMP